MSASPRLGTPERPLHVAIVGAGPSGFYAAEALLTAPRVTTTCDLFDRLPTPYGLVRGGVAPDHQNIKKVVGFYEKTAARPGFRFFGNVKVGKELTVPDLRVHYDAIVYAVGNERDRRMMLPGEDLHGVHSATEFVGWYNGHPDYRNAHFNLNVESVAIIGMGNVAMDVARILAEDPEDLAGSDIPDYALDELRRSRIKRIYVIARRGPAQAAFSPQEIKELGNLKNADLIVDPEQLKFDPQEYEHTVLCDFSTHQNVEYLVEKSKQAPAGKPRQVHLWFLRSPTRFQHGHDGWLSSVELRVNKLVPDEFNLFRAEGTDDYESLNAGMVLKAVGYRGVPIPGVPFSERAMRIRNLDGRVVRDRAKEEPAPGEYVVGWAKRGPSGLIGTNKPDAIGTIKRLVEDFTEGERPPRTASNPGPEKIVEFMKENGIRYVTFEEWKALDREEVRRGQAKNKLREKFTSVERMLEFLDAQKERA